MAMMCLNKLQAWGSFSEVDRTILSRALIDVRTVPAKQDILGENKLPEGAYAVLDGWACLYHDTSSGRRQITSLLLPGDIIDPRAPNLRLQRHAVGALTATKVALISPAAMEQLHASEAIHRALSWGRLVDEATLRAWIVNFGRRSALGRAAHLMCELQVRLERVGLGTDRGFRLPLIQEQLADVLAMTGVHLNRTLRDMRKAELMTHRNSKVAIPNLVELQRVAEFDPAYLLQGTGLAPGAACQSSQNGKATPEHEVA